jgi:hypothetical protein
MKYEILKFEYNHNISSYGTIMASPSTLIDKILLRRTRIAVYRGSGMRWVDAYGKKANFEITKLLQTKYHQCHIEYFQKNELPNLIEITKEFWLCWKRFFGK